MFNSITPALQILGDAQRVETGYVRSHSDELGSVVTQDAGNRTAATQEAVELRGNSRVSRV